VPNATGARSALEQLFVYIFDVAEDLAFDQFQARVAQVAPAAERAVMTVAEELRAEGLKQGLEQGLIQGQRQALERQMLLKFGPLSDAVSARIQAANLEMLGRWLERILTADTPDAVVES
jgi:hypothetical protein